MARRKTRSNAKKTSTVPTRNWSYAIVQPNGLFIGNHKGSQAHQTDMYVLVGGARWRKCPPSAEVTDIRRSRQGHLMFPSLASALASGLGDREQLLAVAEDRTLEGVVLPAVCISEEDQAFLEEELRLAREFDNCYRINEWKRRFWSRLWVVRAALRAGDRRPLLNIQAQRQLNRELAALYKERREFRKATRSRGEPPGLQNKIDKHRDVLHELGEAFKAFYPRIDNSPTPELDAEIKDLAKHTTSKAPTASKRGEDYQPSLCTRASWLKRAKKKVTHFDFHDGAGEVAVTRALLKVRLAELQSQIEVNVARLESLRLKRGCLNHRALLSERHAKANLTTYKEWDSRLSSTTRVGVRAKYGNNTRNSELQKGAPPRLRIVDKHSVPKGARYREVEEGTGSFSVQTKKVTVPELLAGTNSLVGLTLDPNNLQHGILRLKTSTHTLHLPIRYHRELPADAVITRVCVKREKDSSKMRPLFDPNDGFRLKVVLCIESRTFETPARLPGPGCAIAPSFRLLPGGDLRMGVFVDTNGYRAEIVMPHDARSIYLVPLPGPDGEIKVLGTLWEHKHEGATNPGTLRCIHTGQVKRKKRRRGIYASLKYADRGYGKADKGNDADENPDAAEARDAYLQAMRDQLVDWIAENPELVPAWLQKRCQWLKTLRAPAGLTTLAYLFMNHLEDEQDPYPELPLRKVRIKHRLSFAELKEKASDETLEILRDLWYWTDDYRHQSRHQAGNRGRALRHREDTYSCFASWVMTNYATCKVQNISLAKLLRRNSGLEAVMRRQAKTIAIRSLVDRLTRAAQNHGGRAGYVVPPNGYEWAPSDTHYLCGERTHSKHQELTICRNCGESVDRDLNAALNTLAVPEEWISADRRSKEDSDSSAEVAGDDGEALALSD